MISDKQIAEIREHLEAAQNPVFFYDNDADGLCSYVLLRRFIDRGKGVAVRSHPDIDSGYVRKIQELNADYIFVLDRPFLGQNFVEEVRKLNLPIVWIDHHDVDFTDYDYDKIFLYNPTRNKKSKSSEPVTYWSYKVSNREEDVWLAIMGCIADHYMPEFYKIFAKRWPEYWGKVKKPFEAYYETGIGLCARAISFGLKDSVTHVLYLQRFLISAKSPSEIFEEIDSNSPFGRKYKELKKKYDSLVERASKEAGKNLLFFSYGGDLSISSDISNELSHRFPNRYIIVAYSNGAASNLSLRGVGVRRIINKILKKFENSTGGGHDEAVGARIQTADLERFKNEFENELARLNSRKD